MDSLIEKLFREHEAFSMSTFGDRPPTAPLHHLKKEIKECIKEPYDLEEYADCFLLLLDALRLAGFNVDNLVNKSFEKLEINKRRTWGEPDKNGAFQHIDESK